jgi:hypothetical protein
MSTEFHGRSKSDDTIIIGKPSLVKYSIPWKIAPHFIRHSLLWILLSKVVSLASNPQPAGPRLCIYVPQ